MRIFSSLRDRPKIDMVQLNVGREGGGVVPGWPVDVEEKRYNT